MCIQILYPVDARCNAHDEWLRSGRQKDCEKVVKRGEEFVHETEEQKNQ